jgi:Polysaccharide biosynthesis enzyme WcbI
MKRLCFIYANCQGRALGHFLNQSPVFDSEYQIEYLTNYQLMTQKQAIDADLLQRADLFIYQPLRQEHGIYATDHLLTYLHNRCCRISFPYLYNDALWPLFREEKRMINAAPITDLLEAGASVVEIALKFLSLDIDFQFHSRFQNTIQILAQKESATRVKAVEYILDHYKTEKLFLTHNHPSSQLSIHCANQVLAILDYPILKKEEHPHPNEAQLPGYFPMSPYDRSYYQLSYTDDWRHFYSKKKESRWQRVYLQHIMEVCLSRHPNKNGRFYFEKSMLKLLRSLTKYSRFL